VEQLPNIEPSDEEIQTAALALTKGLLVAFPTETVYGLGADAENIDAVAKIYATKGRPSNHPVIVHVAPNADLSYWVSELPLDATKLINAFWPGPLTLILKRADNIPAAVSGGQDTLGIRCPSHRVAQKLLSVFSDLKGGHGGVAAPSANKFGHVSPTMANHVREEFSEELKTINTIASVLDGGQSDVGIESTILDLSRIVTHGAVLLRPGHITSDAIAEVLGYAPSSPDIAAPRVSGSLDSHYAPSTPVALVHANELFSTLEQLSKAGQRVALISHLNPEEVDQTSLQKLLALQQMSNNAVVYAHDLYAALRNMDHINADIILITALPEDQQWLGVNDRLRRAAFDSRSVLQNLLQSNT
jgi:L-threonylcarbamoyladenylate synthase